MSYVLLDCGRLPQVLVFTVPQLMHLKCIFYLRMRSPHVDSYHRWANVCCLFKLCQCEMLHLISSDFFQLKLLHVCLQKFALCYCFFVGFSFFFKLVLAAGGKGMILNGLMCYKRHKEAASSTSYPAVITSRGLGVSGMTKNYSSTQQWLTLGFFRR